MRTILACPCIQPLRRNAVAKYGAKASEKVEKAMHERKKKIREEILTVVTLR